LSELPTVEIPLSYPTAALNLSRASKRDRTRTAPATWRLSAYRRFMSRRKTWAPTNHASNINYHNVAQHKAWSYESGLHKIDVVWLEGSIVGMTPSVYHSWMTRSGLRYDGAPTKAYKTRAASFGLAPLWFRFAFRWLSCT